MLYKTDETGNLFFDQKFATLSQVSAFKLVSMALCMVLYLLCMVENFYCTDW